MDDLTQMANTANYLDMPIVIDATCAVIALAMRRAAKEYLDPSGNPLKISQQDDKKLRNSYQDTFD